MKRVLFVCFIFFTSLFSQAQTLRVSQLLDLVKMDVEQGNEYLTQRKWEFAHSKKNGDYTMVMWENKENGYQFLFFNLIEQSNHLMYHVHDITHFNTIKKEFTNLKYEKLGSFVEENRLSTAYDANDYVFVASTNKRGENGIMVYSIEVFTKLYYQYIYLPSLKKSSLITSETE